MEHKLNIVERLIILQNKGLYFISHPLLAVLGVQIPKSVKFREINNLGGVQFIHRSPGTVIHQNVSIGYRVQIYQNVTIGKSRPWDPTQKSGGCEIEDDVILCAGAKILFSEKKLTIGKGCVIGANAVLTKSTGSYEIWAGIPARKIGIRKF